MAGIDPADLPPAYRVDFASPRGEPGLVAPDSVQWSIFENPVAPGIGGVAAVLLEFVAARIRSGVWDHSIYKVDPIGRSQRTGMAAMVGKFAWYSPRKQRAILARAEANVDWQEEMAQ